MKRLGLWLMFVLALAVVLHIWAMRYVPSCLTSRAVDTIFSKYEEGQWQVNTLGYGSLRYAASNTAGSENHDTVVRDNPDTVTSFAVLDVSRSPVRIHCVVPPGGNYWSVSIFAWNTDTTYVVNDLEAPAPQFDLIVVKKGSTYEAVPGDQVVVSPTRRAVMIVRMNVTDRDDAAEIQRISEVQSEMWVAPVEGVVY